jgi:hypothetical protein
MINSATATHNCNIVTISDHHDPDAAAAEADRPHLEYPPSRISGFIRIRKKRDRSIMFEFVKRETE